MAVFLGFFSLGLLWAGATVLRKVWEARFEAAVSDEVHSLLVATLLTPSLFGALVAALRAWSERKERRWLRLLRRARASLVSELDDDVATLFMGHAEPSSSESTGASVASSFEGDGEPTVYLQINVDSHPKRSALQVDGTFRLVDASGAVLVDTAAGLSLCRKRALSDDLHLQDRLDEALRDADGTVPPSAAIRIEAIRAGDPVVVLGRPRRDARTDHRRLQADPEDPETLLFADGTLSELLSRLERRPRHTRILALASLTLGLAALVEVV